MPFMFRKTIATNSSHANSPRWLPLREKRFRVNIIIIWWDLISFYRHRVNIFNKHKYSRQVWNKYRFEGPGKEKAIVLCKEAK